MKCFIITLLTLFFACKPIANNLYGVNKKVEFEKIYNYIMYTEQKYNINTKYLYYPNKNNYEEFMHLVVDRKVSYFFGTFLNDSMQIRKTDFLKENQSCSGRVLKEINDISNSISITDQIQDNTFKTLSFKNIASNENLDFSNTTKKKIVLIFSYKAGAINKSEFKKIQDIIETKKDYELYIISLDYTYELTTTLINAKQVE